MNGLLIVGAGGHGRVVADAALAGGAWGTVAFVDDRNEGLEPVTGLRIVGTTQQLAALRQRFGSAVVAIGTASRRLALQAQLQQLGYDVPAIQHPTACVSPFARVGAGSVVFAQAAVNPGAILGDACIVNTGASVDHDCLLGDGVHVCPGARIAGDVKVGECTWVGIGAAVRQGITIGRHVTVGAGAVVVADVPDSVTVMGVPARIRGV